MRMRLFLFILCCVWPFHEVLSQLSINATSTNYSIDFETTVTGVNNGTINGSGFNTTPAAGHLDGDAWATSGMSYGSKGFGASSTTGDHARGTSVTSTTGGFYAFDIGSGDIVLGITPGGSDWTPGTLTLKISNNTGVTLSSLSITYDVCEYNSQPRSNSVNFSHSADNSSYTNIGALDYASTEAASGSPTWVSSTKTTTISGLTWADGSDYFVRWTGNDVSGSGSRDRFGLNDIIISATGSAEPEINIIGNSTTIADGDAIPTPADHTDFGSINVSSGSQARTFTIENTGSSDLNLTDASPFVTITGANAADFTLTSTPTSPVASSGSTTFEITFDPSATGTRSATISIANDDTDENPYNFVIEGTGVNSNESDIVEDATYSYSSNIDYTAYAGNPITNATHSVGVLNFIIRDGGSDLTDADTEPTILEDITFTTANGDNILNAALFTTSNGLIANANSITASTIVFSGLSGANVTANDEGSKELILRVSFNQNSGGVTDNEQMQFTITNANVGIPSTGSSSFSAFANANSSITGDINRIEVTASQIELTTQPSDGSVATNLSSFEISATDMNNNVDLDESSCTVALPLREPD